MPPLPPESEVPKVLFWFRVYCCVLCFLYLVVIVSSVVLFFLDPATAEMSQTELLVIGTMMLLLGLVLFIPSLLPLLLKPRRSPGI